MSDPLDCEDPREKGPPYIGVNPHLDPLIVERVGTVLVQSVMLLLPVVLNWTLQRFLKKAVDPILVPLVPKANVSDNLSSPPKEDKPFTKAHLREE